MFNKKQIDRIVAMLSSMDNCILRFRPHGGKTIITSYNDSMIINAVMDAPISNEFIISDKNIDFIKAIAKKLKKDGTADLHEYMENAPELRDTDSVMSDTMGSQVISDFHVDFRLLTNVVKSMKSQSKVVRLRHVDNDRLIISNEEGDISLLGLYRI